MLGELIPLQVGAASLPLLGHSGLVWAPRRPASSAWITACAHLAQTLASSFFLSSVLPSGTHTALTVRTLTSPEGQT